MSLASQAHTSPPQSFQDQKVWRREEGKKALRLPTTLHPNFRSLGQCSLHTHPGKSESRMSPSPSGFPSARARPPITASLWAPRRIQARDCCSQLSSASSVSCSLCPGSAASGCASDRPLSLPRPRLGTTPGSGPRGGRAQWVQVGAPAKSTGLAGFSLHTGDAWAVWTVNGGCLSVALRPGTAPHPGKQRKGALRPEARS